MDTRQLTDMDPSSLTLEGSTVGLPLKISANGKRDSKTSLECISSSIDRFSLRNKVQSALWNGTTWLWSVTGEPSFRNQSAVMPSRFEPNAEKMASESCATVTPTTVSNFTSASGDSSAEICTNTTFSSGSEFTPGGRGARATPGKAWEKTTAPTPKPDRGEGTGSEQHWSSGGAGIETPKQSKTWDTLLDSSTTDTTDSTGLIRGSMLLGMKPTHFTIRKQLIRNDTKDNRKILLRDRTQKCNKLHHRRMSTQRSLSGFFLSNSSCACSHSRQATSRQTRHQSKKSGIIQKERPSGIHVNQTYKPPILHARRGTHKTTEATSNSQGGSVPRPVSPLRGPLEPRLIN